MYIDFPEIFLEGGLDFESKEPVLLQGASLLSSKVRDEGLIIFDLKNASQDINLPKGLIEINEDISWEYMGRLNGSSFRKVLTCFIVEIKMFKQ